MSKTIAPPHNLWTVARVDVNRLPADRMNELIGWVAAASGLGEPECRNWVKPELVVSQSGDDKVYRLHLSRMVRDDQGRMVVDHAADQIQIEPLVYVITDYPAWLPEASHRQKIGVP